MNRVAHTTVRRNSRGHLYRPTFVRRSTGSADPAASVQTPAQNVARRHDPPASRRARTHEGGYTTNLGSDIRLRHVPPDPGSCCQQEVAHADRRSIHWQETSVPPRRTTQSVTPAHAVPSL